MSINKPIAFILMPFDDELNEVYSLFIKNTLEEAGYHVLRADDIQSNQSIMRDIISHIENAELIVADLTLNNPNVYYELGIAHSFLKKVILLTQDIDELPFDLRPYRVIVYDTHFSKIKEAQSELKQLALGVLDNSVIFGSPISDYSTTNAVLQNSEEVLTQTNIEEIDDRGYLDHQSDFEEGTAEHTELTVAMGEVIKKIGLRIAKAATEMNLAGSDKGVSSIKWKKRISTSLAKDLNLYADEIARQNEKQKEILARIENSAEFMIKFLNIETKEEVESAQHMIDSFNEFLKESKYAKEQIINFINTLNDGIGFEKNLNKAYKRLSEILNDTVLNTDQIQSMYRRGVEVTKQKLSDLENK